MKVRWTGESLRLRITPSEMAAIAAGEVVTSRVGAWEVRVVPGRDLALSWQGATATVTVSAADAARLGEPEREGIYAHDGGLRLLLEKDFPCRHPHYEEAREPETERFEPPASFIARKDA